MKITKAERGLLAFVDKHLLLLAGAAITVLGIIARVTMFDILSGDAGGALIPWYHAIKQYGLSTPVGDYNYTYQFLIYIFTLMDLKDPLYAYKISSGVFDLALAVLAGLIAKKISGEGEGRRNALIAYCAVWMSPVVCLNSGAWAQCDSIWVFFALLALYLLDKDQNAWAFLALGASFAFKLQAVFVVPVFLLAYYAKRSFSLLDFALVPASMLVFSLPTVIIGHRSVKGILDVYLYQTDAYSVMAKNFPSFWLALCDDDSVEQYYSLKYMVIAFTVAVLAALMLAWLKNKRPLEGRQLYEMAFLLSFTCALFLPSMHERYGYLYEILALIIAIYRPKTLPLCVVLHYITLSTYGSYLFSVEINNTLLVFLNIAAYTAYVYLLLFRDDEPARQKCAPRLGENQ